MLNLLKHYQELAYKYFLHTDIQVDVEDHDDDEDMSDDEDDMEDDWESVDETGDDKEHGECKKITRNSALFNMMITFRNDHLKVLLFFLTSTSSLCV